MVTALANRSLDDDDEVDVSHDAVVQIEDENVHRASKARNQLDEMLKLSLQDYEDEFAFAEIRDLDASRRWWMGYNDRRREGAWEWEDGTPSGYENWGGGEPNDTGAGEDCGQLNRYTDGGWNDEPCANSLPFVCELD